MSEEKVKVAAEDRRKIQLLWMDMFLARKNFNMLAAIFQQPLPKYAYSKRRNGKKKKLMNTAIRTGSKKFGSVTRGSDIRSKRMQYMAYYMEAGQILKRAEEAFSEALEKQKKRGSIKDLMQPA